MGTGTAHRICLISFNEFGDFLDSLGDGDASAAVSVFSGLDQPDIAAFARL